MASVTSVFPGAPSFMSQGGVEPFKLSRNNIVAVYPIVYPNYGVLDLATGSDKNIWAAELPLAILKITPTGVMTQYALPGQNNAAVIAAGGPGTLWFGGFHMLGKITTGGQVTEYPAPSDLDMLGITKGPDGNMWFTSGGFNVAIGFITPTGSVTEFPLQNGAFAIVTGPDGNLWFTEAGSIGKSTPSGAITEYPGPAGDGPAGITVGPDGYLYAASHLGIWRVSTGGIITQFKGPNIVAYWQSVILGPDKQLWMTSQQNGKLIEFDPKSNTFSSPIQPGGPKTYVADLTMGGDGDVWIKSGSSRSENMLVYEEKITTIGIRLNGEMSFIDPNYGFELGYAVGKTSTQTQTISLGMGESVLFQNVDTIAHSAAFLGSATANNAPWPGSFNGSTTQSAAGTAIGTAGWATGSLNAGQASPVYETGLPGFYMIGCQYHYNTNEMRTVIIVH
jgi:virginiamycin B lyase